MFVGGAGDVPRPTGVAAEAIVGANWPVISETALEQIAEEHQTLANNLNRLGESTDRGRTHQSQLLRGHAGDGHSSYVGRMTQYDYDLSDHFLSKVNTANGFASATRGAKTRLAQIMETAGPEYDTAMNSRDPLAVAAVVARYRPEVEAVMLDAWTDITLNPPPTPLPGNESDVTPLSDEATDEYKPVPGESELAEGDSADSQTEGLGDQPKELPVGADSHAETAADDLGTTDSPKPMPQPTGEIPTPEGISSGVIPPMSSTPSLGATSPTSPASSLGSLTNTGNIGSMLRSASSPGSLASSPASSASTQMASSSNPLAEAVSQFNSGLASSMGSSNAISPAASLPPAAPLDSYTSQQAMTASSGSTQPTSLASSTPASTPATTSHMASPISGGTMMPPTGMTGALAPYNQAASNSVAPAGPTHSGTPSAPPSSAAGTAPASSPGSPLLAGATGAVAGAAAEATTTNPDLIAAQQLLAALVSACGSKLIFWAVSVLRTPLGAQMVLASSVGGGTYLPTEALLPSSVRLATLDPALPPGWAEGWMGWQSPLSILVDHYERLRMSTSGLTMSAMATTELWPRPPDCGGDFAALRHEHLLASGTAPVSGCTRLTVTDSALAARIQSLDRGGDVSAWVASELTAALIRAAAVPDATGQPLASRGDAAILERVHAGSADAKAWTEYNDEVEQRCGGAVSMPEMHAPRDADDSVSSVNARLWYTHYYRMGRIAEMVKCWSASPIRIDDVAYCGLAAGLGDTVTSVVGELELRLAELESSSEHS